MLELMHAELTCPICLDVMAGPVTVGCGHTFCGFCLHTYWGRIQVPTERTCPVCRTPHSGAWVVNTFLMKLLHTAPTEGRLVYLNEVILGKIWDKDNTKLKKEIFSQSFAEFRKQTRFLEDRGPGWEQRLRSWSRHAATLAAAFSAHVSDDWLVDQADFVRVCGRALKTLH